MNIACGDDTWTRSILHRPSNRYGHHAIVDSRGGWLAGSPSRLAEIARAVPAALHLLRCHVERGLGTYVCAAVLLLGGSGRTRVGRPPCSPLTRRPPRTQSARRSGHTTAIRVRAHFLASATSSLGVRGWAGGRATGVAIADPAPARAGAAQSSTSASSSCEGFAGFGAHLVSIADASHNTYVMSLCTTPPCHIGLTYKTGQRRWVDGTAYSLRAGCRAVRGQCASRLCYLPQVHQLGYCADYAGVHVPGGQWLLAGALLCSAVCSCRGERGAP